MPRIAKGLPSSSNGGGEDDHPSAAVDRRLLRSRYLAVKNLINDKRDDISRVNSDKFNSIIQQVESLHKHVQKPRELVADAEALLDITNTLMSSVKAHCSDGVTPSDFITCLLRDFVEQGGAGNRAGDHGPSVNWKSIGLAMSYALYRPSGCCTMLGPMNTEVKRRKVIQRKTRTRPSESSRPEELEEASEERTETDKNMAVMFDILRKNRRLRLEKLVLNRSSFVQTVENIFALSFLVKDGRVEITVDENGFHIICKAISHNQTLYLGMLLLPMQLPLARLLTATSFSDLTSGIGSMMESIEAGEELMPNRNSANMSSNSEPESSPEQTRAPLPTTPIRKLSRNRGLVLQEQTVVADSPESDESQARVAAIRKRKRKL